MKVTVSILLEKEGKSLSSSSYTEDFDNEDMILDNLAQAIVYAIPKHEFPKFDVLEFFRECKTIGHGEDN